MKDLILKVEHLHKNIGKKKILKDVSFEMHEGDILGFIGPNGAGKTTAIKLILGLQKITSGKVTINGYDNIKEYEQAISKVGAIVENPDSYMNISGYQNLKLIANYYSDIKEEQINKCVKLVGLEKRIKDKVSKYSLGMRQRLGIAGALLNNPKLLILDEPTNGLDPEGIKELRELLTRLAQQEKLAIFISSHNLSELESFCTKVCIISNGKIIETSDVKSIKQKHDLPTYRIEVNKVKGLPKLLKDYQYEELDNNNFEITINKKDVKDIIRLLVENNYDIYSCYEVEMSLEEAFLKKTGGNVID